MKRKGIVILSLCYFVLSLLIITLELKVITNCSETISSIKAANNSIANNNVLLKRIMLWQYSADGKSIDNRSFLYNDDSQEKSISELVANGSKLFIYVHSSKCQACLDKLIEQFDEIAKYIDTEDLIFFGNFNDSRHMKLFERTYSSIDNVYNSTGAILKSPLLSIGVPVMFIVNEDLQVNCIYIADKTISEEMTIPYFQTVGKRFFDWDVELFETDGKHHCSDTNCQHNHQ